MGLLDVAGINVFYGRVQALRGEGTSMLLVPTRKVTAQKKIEVVAPSARQSLNASAAQPPPRNCAVDHLHNTKNLT